MDKEQRSHERALYCLKNNGVYKPLDEESIHEPAHGKNGPYGFPICGYSNPHAQSPIWATDMHFCLKLPQGLYYMSANRKGSKGSGKTVLMRSLAEPLLVANVISTIFSCAGILGMYIYLGLATPLK